MLFARNLPNIFITVDNFMTKLYNGARNTYSRALMVVFLMRKPQLVKKLLLQTKKENLDGYTD